jgi:hypothetical protein
MSNSRTSLESASAVSFCLSQITSATHAHNSFISMLIMFANVRSSASMNLKLSWAKSENCEKKQKKTCGRHKRSWMRFDDIGNKLLENSINCKDRVSNLDSIRLPTTIWSS